MSWLTCASQTTIGIRLREECTGHHHGQTDCVIKAYVDNRDDSFSHYLPDRLVGYLSYCVFEGNYHIQHIEVAKDMQRQGIATRLFRDLEKLAAENGGKVIHTNQTPDGAAWKASLGE